MTAVETQVRDIVPNAFCKSVVVRVVGVPLLSCVVDVEGIAIGPSIDFASAT